MRGWVVLAVLMSGCMPKAVHERLVALEARVAALEARPAAPDAPNDALAVQLYDRANQEVAAGELQAAKATLQALIADHPRTRAAGSAQRMLQELNVVGKPAGDLSDVVEWYQGEADLSQGRHLVVFFETWCPHCRREVPMMGDRLAGRDASGLLLTRLSRDGTADEVKTFLTDNAVTVPAAHESGRIAERFGVNGIPAAAVVHDGQIVWRGHPARLEGELLDQLLPPL